MEEEFCRILNWIRIIVINNRLIIQHKLIIMAIIKIIIISINNIINSHHIIIINPVWLSIFNNKKAWNSIPIYYCRNRFTWWIVHIIWISLHITTVTRIWTIKLVMCVPPQCKQVTSITSINPAEYETLETTNIFWRKNTMNLRNTRRLTILDHHSWMPVSAMRMIHLWAIANLTTKH